jgi:hypothetical protein
MTFRFFPRRPATGTATWTRELLARRFSGVLLLFDRLAARGRSRPHPASGSGAAAVRAREPVPAAESADRGRVSPAVRGIIFFRETFRDKRRIAVRHADETA